MTKTEDLYRSMVELQIKTNESISKLYAQNEIANNTLRGIEEHLAKLNSKVATHEKIINERAEAVSDLKHLQEIVAPMTDKIRSLEDCNLSNKAIKRFMGAMFSAGIALGGLVVSVIAIILKLV